MRSVVLAVFLSGCAAQFDVVLPGDGDGTPYIPFPARPGGSVTPTPTPDPPTFGHGIDDGLTAGASDSIDNECMPVSGSGTLFQLVGTPSPAWNVPGRQVLLLQLQEAFVDMASLNDTSTTGTAGAWEIRPVANATASGTLTLAQPATHTYLTSVVPAAAAQACLVREYTTLVLNVTVAAPPWDGVTGGVLVFFVRDMLEVMPGAVIDAAGAGFRGGPTSGASTMTQDPVTWDAPADFGGRKGEGIDMRSFVLHGMGNYRNAGGGGTSAFGGGGGGGGRGAGGDGTPGGSGIAGRGGAPLGTGTSRLFFGAGGGGGHQGGAGGGRGGFGGGIAIVGANAVTGTLRIEAGAKAGIAATAADAGGGGGGGGGTVVVWTPNVMTCVAEGAIGGTGMNGGNGGPGGGGGCFAPAGSMSSVAAAAGGGGATNGEIAEPGPMPDW